MRTFDALWIAYQAETNPTWGYQYKAEIGGQTYTDAEIWTFEKTGGLISDDFSLGNCVIQALAISIAEKSGVTIAKNAKVEVFVRITGGDGTTLWHSLGVYFIDTRKRLDGGKIELGCLDRMAYTDVLYLTDGEELDDYPMAMDAAMTRIYTQLGTTLDARCTISSSMTIEYPNDMTMRQVLGQIASAHGGNFCITEDDKLRLVVPGYGTALATIASSNAEKTVAINNAITYDSAAMIYTENGDYYESGTTKLYTLDITNTWATQAMTDAIAAAIAGYTYTPYEANGADLDPAIELGDHITIDGIACNVWKWKWNNRLYCDLECPSSRDNAVSEFGYTGTITQALKKKVTLGTPYFGATISRESGLVINKSDGSSQAVFNSEQLAMRALVEGVMTDKIYFDPAQGTYVFDGKLSADVIAALSILITPNLYTTKATIAELTVDELDTSDKVQNYLDSDTDDVNYVHIFDQYVQFKTAEYSGGSTQATNRDGDPLYWIDAEHTGATAEVTEWPVMVYNYDELTKMQIGFESDGTNLVPKIALGAGTGIEGDQDGKGFIYKDDGGLYLEYHTYGAEGVINDGDIYRLGISEAGIDLSQFTTIQYNENVQIIGLTRVWVQDEIPSLIHNKDVWVDTDDYTRYDITAITDTTTLVESGNEILFCTGSPTITLHGVTTGGIVKRIHNIGTGVVTLAGTFSGKASMKLYPGEAVELMTSGEVWGVL